MMEFEYSDADFILTTEPWNGSKPQLSKFDEEVQTRWDHAVENGHFRYKLDSIEKQIIKGDKHYVAELNVKRAQERRKPQPVTSVNEPFNPDLFNFNKIKAQEVLFRLQYSDRLVEGSSGRETNGGNNLDTEARKVKVQKEENLVVINVSPLGYGHILLIPDREACSPQVLTEPAIKLALESMLLSRHRGFRLGFNSMCAFASVNHLHVHAYYLEEELCIEYCDVTEFADICYELTSWPVRGFAFQLHGTSVGRITRVLHSISSYFTRENIAHNVFITRGTQFGEGRHSTKRTVRLFIWPRKFAIEDNTGEMFNVAAVELAGHLPVREREGFWELTEADVEKNLAKNSLNEQEIQQIKMDLKSIILNLT